MPDHSRLLSRLNQRQQPAAESLEQWFALHGQRAWDRLHDSGRADSTLIDDEVLLIATPHAVENQGS